MYSGFFSVQKHDCNLTVMSKVSVVHEWVCKCVCATVLFDGLAPCPCAPCPLGQTPGSLHPCGTDKCMDGFLLEKVVLSGYLPAVSVSFPFLSSEYIVAIT